MTKQEQITVYIENYISNYVEDEIVLSAAEIRKWPCVAKLCENHDSANICKAMKSVKYGECYVAGAEDSTTFKMLFTQKFQNTRTEDVLSKIEMDSIIEKTG